MKIYTKTGDSGKTALLGGEKTSKADARIEIYGSCDTLNSHLGFARSLLKLELKDELKTLNNFKVLQGWLLTLGSHLASPKKEREKFKVPDLDVNLVTTIESWIDEMESKITPLKNFILPGGGSSSASSYLHVVRTECRSFERKLTHWLEKNPDEIDDRALALVNRLSDYFFVCSRYVAHLQKIPETLWP